MHNLVNMKQITILITFLTVLGLSTLSQENPIFIESNTIQPVTGNSNFPAGDTNTYVNGMWSRLSELPAALLGTNTYYDSLNGRIFICGGANSTGTPTDSCLWYNISGGSYSLAASLPRPRWSGKLVKVKDTLYLVGSIDTSFTTPDGLIFRYSLQNNTWSIADTIPAPFVHEAAVCVLKDSLIAVIGGSTTGFQGAINLVRIYDPATGIWKNSNVFPVNMTTGHAEYIQTELDSLIFAVGGFGAGNLNTVFRGRVDYFTSDTIFVAWQLYGSVPFSRPLYRVAGTKWNDFMLFGPGMTGSTSVNEIWGLRYQDSIGVWTGFLPASGDTTANISSFAAATGSDSNYFYLFGGFKNPNAINTAQKYSFITPPPIGITNISVNVPGEFRLYQNYPNPFNPVTRIKFDYIKSSESDVNFAVYDVTGRQVYRYKFTGLTSGSYEIDFDGSELSSGLYLYRLQNGKNSATGKMILLK